MGHSSRLTAKSQITVPKDVRRALGVGPGEHVLFDIADDGRVTLRAADSDRERALRKADFLRRVAAVREEFRRNDPLPGMDGFTYQRMMRGDGPEI